MAIEQYSIRDSSGRFLNISFCLASEFYDISIMVKGVRFCVCVCLLLLFLKCFAIAGVKLDFSIRIMIHTLAYISAMTLSSYMVSRS